MLNAYLSLVVLLDALGISSDSAIHAAQRHQDIRVVPTNPGLVVKTSKVEGLARVRQMTVVFLQDLVESGEIEINVLLELEEVLRCLVHHRACLRADVLATTRYDSEEFSNLSHLRSKQVRVIPHNLVYGSPVNVLTCEFVNSSIFFISRSRKTKNCS